MLFQNVKRFRLFSGDQLQMASGQLIDAEHETVVEVAFERNARL